MLIVIALGGNALLQRGEPLEANLLFKNCLLAAQSIAQIATQHQVIIVHGNGPQVGLLALQAEAYKAVQPYPFDILCAESQGMIGYPLQQALSNQLPDFSIVTLLTQVLINPNDPAFSNPTKPIGPFYSLEEAKHLIESKGWQMKPDGEKYRRVVPSPQPLAIIEINQIKQLIQPKTIVIAAGGGGIPCIRKADGQLIGSEAVIDKDLSASLLAQTLQADVFIILTDIAAVYEHWHTPEAKAISSISAQALEKMTFPAGSMQPKVKAVCQFIRSQQKEAFIGHLSDLESILAYEKGTHITDASSKPV